MPENEDLVTLEGGQWRVPQRWTSPRTVPRSKQGSFEDFEGWVSELDISMSVEMEGTNPIPGEIHIFPLYPGAATKERIESIDWAATIDWIVLHKAMEVRLGPVEWVPPEEQEHFQKGVQQALRTARRKNGVTVERLQEVLRLYDEGGIQAVQKKVKKGEELSRSYAYQLLNRARKEIQQ